MVQHYAFSLLVSYSHSANCRERRQKVEDGRRNESKAFHLEFVNCTCGSMRYFYVPFMKTVSLYDKKVQLLSTELV